MTFYGLSMNTGNLGGNFYLNFMLIGAMDYPATVVVIVFLDRLGRRKLHCIAMTTGGLACLSTILTTSYGKECTDAFTYIPDSISSILEVFDGRHYLMQIAKYWGKRLTLEYGVSHKLNITAPVVIYEIENPIM